MRTMIFTRSLLLPVALLGLAGCARIAQMTDGPPADMTETLPPQGRPDRHYHPRPGEEPDYVAGGVPQAPPMRDDGPSPGMGGGMGGGPGTMTLGSGGADITPRPATPDTEVSYGRNGQ